MGLGKDISDYYPHELLEEVIRQLNDCDEHKEEWPDLTKAFNQLTETLLKQNIINATNLNNIIFTITFNKNNEKTTR
jgi:hypothetical protein